LQVGQDVALQHPANVLEREQPAVDGFKAGGAQPCRPVLQNFLFRGQKGFHPAGDAGQIRRPVFLKKKTFLDIFPLQPVDAIRERLDRFRAVQITARVGFSAKDLFQPVLICFFPKLPKGLIRRIAGILRRRLKGQQACESAIQSAGEDGRKNDCRSAN